MKALLFLIVLITIVSCFVHPENTARYKDCYKECGQRPDSLKCLCWDSCMNNNKSYDKKSYYNRNLF